MDARLHAEREQPNPGRVPDAFDEHAALHRSARPFLAVRGSRSGIRVSRQTEQQTS